jgi:hypothetical protein
MRSLDGEGATSHMPRELYCRAVGARARGTGATSSCDWAIVAQPKCELHAGGLPRRVTPPARGDITLRQDVRGRVLRHYQRPRPRPNSSMSACKHARMYCTVLQCSCLSSSRPISFVPASYPAHIPCLGPGGFHHRSWPRTISLSHATGQVTHFSLHRRFLCR